MGMIYQWTCHTWWLHHLKEQGESAAAAGISSTEEWKSGSLTCASAIALKSITIEKPSVWMVLTITHDKAPTTGLLVP